ncbi:MAG: hypothetical protein AB1611_07010 [bacterium]
MNLDTLRGNYQTTYPPHPHQGRIFGLEDGIMAEQDLSQCREQAGSVIIEDKEADNVKRILTMLEKA